MITQMSELLTAKQLADKLQISHFHTLKLTREKKIPVIMVGKAKRYDYSKVIEKLNKDTEASKTTT